MHELALSEGVLRLIQAEAAQASFSQVLGVHLEVGALAGVDIEALRFGFDAVCRGTIAAAATLEISATPGEAWCASCAATVPIDQRIDPCPHCGAYGLRVTRGADMLLKSLEVA